MVSGFGNVAWGAIKKITALGGKALTISGPDGYVYDPDGIATEEKVNYLLEMRASGRDRVQDYADKFGAEFHQGEKPWGVKGDVILPCATQNEVTLEDAKKIVANGAKYYIEVSNMPTTADALNYLMDQKNLIVAPSKAVNAGGVCVSGLEMSQNSQRLSWTAEEVDAKLHQAMINIHKHSVEAAARYGLGYNLVAGANIAGFEKGSKPKYAVPGWPPVSGVRHPVLSVFNVHFTRYQSGFYSVFFRISIDIKNCPYSFDNSTIHFHPERMLFITLHFKITFPFQKYPSFISDKSCRKCQFTCRIKIYNCTIGQG